MVEVLSIGLPSHVYISRRLTVPELEQYIREGCACSVCEFARREIRDLDGRVP